ncbi:MAG: DUF2341 domain-containing protein, partial [Candidatus Aenigmatarchaeota archaeon]
MKMFEMKKYLIILVAILMLLAFFSVYLTSPTGFIISIFSKSPEIINASVEPIKVEPSDYMIIKAEIKDEYGIESVKADMAGIEIINLSLVEGNATHGVYQATWFVHSVEVGKTYNATIIARNVKGKESFVRVEFHDDPVFCCRREINGTGPIINDASYISFTLNTSYLISQGKMRSDCGDIRFTDSRSFDSALWTRNFSYNIQGCWLQGFSYRKPITITNIQNSNNLTDYQVLVTLDTASLISAGKMRSDCGDIRFTDSDGLTLLNYWIESGCNSANTRIWVKIPSIPAGSTKTIYVYYGNPSASSMSNGDATFDFFDDFEDGVINTNKWTTVGVVTESNGIISIGSTSNRYDKLMSVGSYGPS